MTETPKCPYCGAEMENHSYCWICRKCHSGSPIVIYDEKAKSMTEDEKEAYAREAALRRAEPENRVLTMEEITEMAYKDDWEFAWLECQYIPEYLTQKCPYNANEAKVWFLVPGNENEMFYDTDDYNKTWRCWLRKPTAEEMGREKWEE